MTTTAPSPTPQHAAVAPPRASRSRSRRRGGNPTATPTPPPAVTGRSRRRGDIAATAAGVLGGLISGATLVVLQPTWGTPGGPATVLGSVTAVAGTYLCLVLLLLISRIPWLEREAGHDRMLAWHRSVAPWSLLLIAAHVLFTTVGYAWAVSGNPVAQFWELMTTYPWMMPATVAFIAMVTLGVISWRPIRTRMSYETWWVTHLYFYLAVALAFGHQINTGTVFTLHPSMRWIWLALYAFVFGTILICRVVLPLRLSLRHQLRVHHVEREAPGLVSVYVTGHDLAGMKVAGGQFFQWRFLTRQWWWQAHPYSVSAVPSGEFLRVTVKHLGDQSGDLAFTLKPGTRVIAEGPYGTFTAAARSGDHVAAFAAGVGITPIRAMLDDLPATTDVTLVYRVSSLERIALQDELEAMCGACGWRLVYLHGSREQHPITFNYLSRFVPDLAARDVYVCGPANFGEAVLAAARTAGVPEERLHHESFAF